VDKRLSIVIPARNAQDTLAACLKPLFLPGVEGVEVIVVDDRSEDGTVDVARRFPAKVLLLEERSGAAAARNKGARIAQAGRLLFLDADVSLLEGSLEALWRVLEAYPDADAVQGVYGEHIDSDSPAAVARHYFKRSKTHSLPDGFIQGVNSYCFSVKRELFLSHGGFDSRAEGAEDVELGMRLAGAGRRIVLDKRVQVSHGKGYALGSLLRAGFRKNRARTGLLLDRWTGKRAVGAPMSFSLGGKERMFPEFAGAIFALLLAGDLALLAVFPSGAMAAAGLALVVVFGVLNLGYVDLIRREKGWALGLQCLGVRFLELLTTPLGVLAAAGGRLLPAGERAS